LVARSICWIVCFLPRHFCFSIYGWSFASREIEI
jgi:hypothetical protein